MAVILFYAPFNRRSRDTESLMIAFRKQGHRVIFLAQGGESEITEFLRKQDVECSTQGTGSASGPLQVLSQVLFFIRFCRRHRVDVVYSHLASASFVAVLGQFLIKARVIVCRHHVDEGAWKGVDRSFSYRITYRWAKTIIVVSRNARRYMIDREGINPEKIFHIDLAYDFQLFDKPDTKTASEIRNSNNGKLLLLTACRLTPSKRPALSLQLTRRLRDLGIDARLIILGEGELMDELKSNSDAAMLANQVLFKGLVRNVFDYLEACDVLVHPSASESSCVIVKEAGLAGKSVLVCRGVGDFDEFLEDGVNAFMVDKDQFVEQATEIIKNKLFNSELRVQIGKQLGRSIRERFELDKILEQYKVFNQPA